MGVRLWILLIAVIVGLTLLPSKAESHSWYSGARQACSDSVRPMVCYHNYTRAKWGLPKLRVHFLLDKSARIKAYRIRQCTSGVDHTPCGDPMNRAFYLSGYLPWPSYLVGENLARGYTTRWGAFHALMHSDSHRANIMNRRFRDFGRVKLNRLYVLHYGRRY